MIYDASPGLLVLAGSHTLSSAGVPEDEWAKFTHWKGLHAKHEFNLGEVVFFDTASGGNLLIG